MAARGLVNGITPPKKKKKKKLTFGGQSHQQSNSKPISQMTIIERCAYCHK